MLLETMKELSSTLGLLETDPVPRREFPELVNLLASLRNELRGKREYALSDRIREQMQKAGVLVEDEAK
jgi:cysteinyl-tRNA synthetase